MSGQLIINFNLKNDRKESEEFKSEKVEKKEIKAQTRNTLLIISKVLLNKIIYR